MSILKALTIEHIDLTLRRYFCNTNQVTIIYTDGSLLTSTGKAGCALVIHEQGEEKETRSLALPRWSSSTHCELQALAEAVQHATMNERNTLIVCDSQAALQSINSPRPVYGKLVSDIRKHLYLAEVAGQQYSIVFTWIPSHVGIKGNDDADKSARAMACESADIPECLTINQFKALAKCENKESTILRTNSQRPESGSIRHYDLFRDIKHNYGEGKQCTGPCDRIAARIRLGYRKMWKVRYDAGATFDEGLSKCVLCDVPLSDMLEHYIVFCPKLKHFRPSGMGFFELCVHFCNPEILYPILNLYPNFRF